MAVVEDGVVLAIGLLDLIEALRDQEGAHAIASEKGEARLVEIQSAERWKLVKHHEQLEIGRAHVCTPVTNAHLVCRLLLEKNKSAINFKHNKHTTNTCHNTKQHN